MKRLLLLMAWPGMVAAALPSLTPEELLSRAEVIVTGTAVESRTLLHRMPRTSFYYVRLKVKVEDVEKGREQIRGAEFIDVRCWHNPLDDSTGPVGQDPIPADGARFRSWLKHHEEGYFEALEPNGFELLDGEVARVFPSIARPSIGTGQIIGGIVGLLAVFAAAFIRFRGRGPRDRSYGGSEVSSPPDSPED